MSDRATLARRALTAFLFLTGGSALVYQVLWTRYLGLLLGSSAVAVVVVLAAFMGGLAVGSWLFGRLVDRPLRRLTLYASLELGVGLYCAAFPALLAALEEPYLTLVAPLYAGHGAAFAAARLLFAALLLLPPTVLMGGTLPAASRFLIGLEPGIRRAVARLYWVNSLGAVLGALLAGFWLVPGLGLDRSMEVAAAVNILVGIGAIALRARVGEDPGARPEADPTEPPLSRRAARAALLAVTVSGFAALVLEVAWTRLLALVLGGSTYAFTLMVATFILGIALGSRWVARPLFAGRDPVALLGAFLAAVAVLLAISIPLYPKLPYLFLWLRGLVNPVPRAYPIYQALLLGVCGLVMLLPTAAMGATLPLASRIASRDPAVAGGRIGLTWALNTAGTLLGALLGGLVFLPRIGLQATLALVAALYGAAALLALAGSEALRNARVAAAAALALAALVSAPLLPRWWAQDLAAGTYRRRGQPTTFANWARATREAVVHFHRDGPTCSVTVTEFPAGHRALRVNGKVDASNGGDMATQLLLGHIPALLAPAPVRSALVIGLGSGATVAALAAHPGLRVTAVEIEPAVVEAARLHFGDVNGGALDDPRVEVLVEDAKTIFQLAGRRYDIVVSEPSNPWLAGIGGLFSREFFEKARARLVPGGLMAQWMHAYEMDDDTVRIVLRTFRSVFREVTVWNPQGTDYVLLGSDGPQAVDAPLLEARIAVPRVRGSLEKIGVRGVHAFLAHQVLSPAGADLLASEGMLNTDQLPTLEFYAPIGFFVGGSTRMLERADERNRNLGRSLLYHQYARLRPLDHDAALAVARSLGSDQPRVQEAALRRALELRPDSAEAADDLARLLAGRPDAWRAVPALTAPAPSRRMALARLLLPAALAVCRNRSTPLFDAPVCAEAIRLGEDLARHPAPDAAERRSELAGLARAYLWSGRARESAEVANRLLAEPEAPAEERAQWLGIRAAARLQQGDGPGARADAAEALGSEPTDANLRRLLGLATDTAAAEDEEEE